MDIITDREYQKTSKSYSFSYDRLLATIVGDGAAAQPFSLSMRHYDVFVLDCSIPLPLLQRISYIYCI